MRLEVEGKDAYYFSDRHSEQSDDYNLLHASLGWEQESWRVVLWGRNLTDEDYTVRGFGSFGNDPRNGYVTEPYYQFGEPRMYGSDSSVCILGGPESVSKPVISTTRLHAVR